MKQQLVSIVKQKSLHCGFDLCPNKYKYLANPVLLEKIFPNQNSKTEKIKDVKRPRYLDENDSMYTTNCIGCNQEYLLTVENPVCTSCRGIL